jgi:UTP--glucose-1-phosphate uridylyltransferase
MPETVSGTQALDAARSKMRAAGLPDASVAAFAELFGRFERGDTGTMSGDELEPVESVPSLAELPDAGGRAPLDRTVVIKVNGGLGTTMGLSAPKSLVEVRPGLSFLDLIARQVLALRRRHGVRLPLVLMNSESTRAPSLAALERYPDLPAGEMPLDFLQGREPRLRADDLMPVSWPADPEREWCPPGHGDIYTSLAASGTLGALLERGYRWAFVSNADNLGAVVDERILAWLDAERPPFLMEVVEGTAADRKGGHIARRDGRLVLRETAQAPPGDDSFTDFRRWRFYNTNNLWVHLPRLAELIEARGGSLSLQLIVNRKNVVPGDASTPEVLQLETAMGAALGAIDGAAVLQVPRTRFAPVKTTSDLLVLRSDVYEVDEATGSVKAIREEPPVVDLDPRFYGRLEDFERRFPIGPPSLARAASFTVRGDVTFGHPSAIVGDAQVSG